jgi:DNA-binding response OmpR family regulator
MNLTKILYAEDDATLAFLTRDYLLQQQYEVDHFSNGDECLQAFMQNQYDICLLDVMMPGLDGFALAAAIRKINQQVPIIFLTAKTLQEDKLMGLRIGADDYLVKPFSMEELVLKIEIFLKRSVKAAPATIQKYQAGKYVFDPANYLLIDGKVETQLTQREAALLQYFLDHVGQVLKREQILNVIWGQDDYFYGRSLDVFVSRLRKFLAAEPAIKIETIHGIGFKMHLSL